MLSLKERVVKNFINAMGWRSKQKYIIIESDDWGAVRMPSRAVYESLKNNNIEVDKFSFDRNDSLESEEDLKQLFNSLRKFQDCNGNNPVMTAYAVVANPNFEKIEASERKEYFYETILETYKREKHTENVANLWKEGIRENIFVPQYHGREHVHVKRYMEAINSDSLKEQLAFKHHAIISSKSSIDCNPYSKNYFAGQDFCSDQEFNDIERINKEGLELFEKIFGFKSETFTAQGGYWGDHLLETLKQGGVKLIGGRQFHYISNGNHKFINKYWGKTNYLGQIHWRRNCMFEPGRDQNFPWVEKCIAEMEIAFRWGKPAVISSHRENFIGSIFVENRAATLQKLESLIEKTLQRWPDVQFISTAQLAEIMNKKKNR